MIYSFRFQCCTAQLTTRWYAQLQDAFRPATKKTCSRMFADFLAFLASLRAMFIIYNPPILPCRDEDIQMFVRSLKIYRPLAIKTKSLFIVFDIVSEVETLEFSQTFGFRSWLFFSFFRLPNVVPQSKMALTFPGIWLKAISSFLIKRLLFLLYGLKPFNLEIKSLVY